MVVGRSLEIWVSSEMDLIEDICSEVSSGSPGILANLKLYNVVVQIQGTYLSLFATNGILVSSIAALKLRSLIAITGSIGTHDNWQNQGRCDVI